jgi:hypothetical protein
MMPDMIDPEPAFRYIPRTEEQRRIIAEADSVRAAGKSRAVLLYGQGGTGKTRLVRELPKIHERQGVVWLDPIDVDDSQQWLLSNLESYVADELDPQNRYFGPYRKYMSELPRHRIAPTSRESVLDHLNRIKAVFTQCYKSYVDETGNSIVITFDTIEAIRGIYLVRTLTRWIKELPGTLFVLAGRSLPSADGSQDPVRAALENSPAPMNVTVISLGEFDAENSREYLARISEEAGLSADDTEKLVHLSQGQPLWLAFTVDYLSNIGLPEEAHASLDEIKRDLPFHGAPTAAGRDRVESFKRRLVAPYQGADFRHEAIKRLAVVRESISQSVWQRLMSDRPLPSDLADGNEAWEDLRRTEWIRLRANRRYVTLHDAVAEELAQRVLDLHDPDGRWRRELWRRAAAIYADEVAELEGRLARQLPDVDRRLRAWDGAKKRGGAPEPAGNDAALIRDVAKLDRWQQELNRLKAAQLFYQLLSSFSAGARRFVELLGQARERHDVLFEDLLTFQMQRFLPGGADENTLGDTIGAAIGKFRKWLPDEGRDSYLDVGLEMAAYLISREQADAALRLLDWLPEPRDHQRRYRLRNLQGNACMRIPRRVREGGERFQEALHEASQLPLPDRHRYSADAYKELGFYYRNVGHWKHADEAYEKARDAILKTLSPVSPAADREEMASIHTNWAYVKGIGGRYNDGINLVESAITVRSRLGRRHEQAISCSVKGEVYRYQRQFKEAWDAYAEAEQLFGETSASWLGVIYQEQAICLFQSIGADVQLLTPPKNPAREAESLIEQSLDLCRVLNARAYPSALNRAGRIFGSKEPDRGLRYLREGAERAQELSDGWFWIASLIEYAELCYRAWSDDHDAKYIEQIPDIAAKLQQPEMAELEFPELRGRWNILQGHLAMHRVLEGDDSMLEAALENYRIGFPLITHGWVGSYGASSIPGEFRKFSDLVWQLPAQTRARWREELYRSWSDQQESATQLLARLEELY